jgi:predicted N-acyltransferase
VKVEVYNRLSDIAPGDWDALVGNGLAFLEWGWLAALEESGCVGARTGWLPQHLTLWDGSRLIGACPLYLKSHSQGEFVFDHTWADAAQRAGIQYFPKLLVAVPFTPATGARFLAHPASDRTAIMRTLAGALTELCRENALSSVHVNFCLPDELEVLGQHKFHHRLGYQFQWTNPGWHSFDDYLAAFRSKRRVQIKRERREPANQGIEITAHAGEAIPDDIFDPMFRLYKATIDKLYWGRQYLNAEFFDLLRRRWKHRLVFFVARRRGNIVAGAVTVRKGDTLYGRYWGTFEDLRHLHFNVCYYASIEYCLREGLTRFEPGAGGEFKHLRGFDARPTHSAHYLADTRLARAVADYLARERQAVTREIDWLGEQSALKRES